MTRIRPSVNGGRIRNPPGVPLGHPAEEAGGTTSLADALPVTIRRNQQEDVMHLPLRPALIAVAVIAATGASPGPCGKMLR